MKLNLSDNLFGFEQPDTTGQRVFRKMFELFIVVASCNLAWKWGVYTLRISDVVLPLGVARYVDIAFMHGNSLPIWNAGLITILLVIGFAGLSGFGRWSYSVAFGLLIFQYAARFSLGEIPHSANLVGLGLLGYALGRITFPDSLSGNRFAVGFSYLFVGLSYTFSAWSKLIASGIFWPDGRHLWMWINEKAVDEIARSGFVELNFVQEWALSSIGLATVFLLFGLITEFFAFLVWFKRFRYPVILAIIGLHMGIWMTMDILFTLSVWELAILGLPWAYLIDRFLNRNQKSNPPDPTNSYLEKSPQLSESRM